MERNVWETRYLGTLSLNSTAVNLSPLKVFRVPFVVNEDSSFDFGWIYEWEDGVWSVSMDKSTEVNKTRVIFTVFFFILYFSLYVFPTKM